MSAPAADRSWSAGLAGGLGAWGGSGRRSWRGPQGASDYFPEAGGLQELGRQCLGVRGGEQDLLSLCGDAEEMRGALAVQFGQNVVQQEHRRFPRRDLHQAYLSQFE